MMDYKEMAAIVKERGDAIIAEKAEHTRRIRKVSVAVSGIAASAAAAFCIWHLKDSAKFIDTPPDNSNIIEDITEPVTSPPDEKEAAVLSTTASRSSASASVTKAGATAVSSADVSSSETARSSDKASASYTAIDSIITSAAVQTEFVPVETAETVTTYDHEHPLNEGRIIMKRFAALSTALLMLPNVSAANAASEEPLKYTRTDKYPDYIQNLITCIEDYDLDIDINDDGKFDIFDAYAVERNYTDDLPEYIVNNINTCEEKINEFKQATGKNASICDITEYFVRTQPVKLEYFDPNYYIDNCPDTYAEPVPLEYIRHDDGDFDIIDFYDTMFYKESDGKFERLKYHCSDSENKLISPIHLFIENYLKSAMCYTNASYNVMAELMDNGLVDADIDSDGEINFDDIMMLYNFQDKFYDDYYETCYGYWDENDEYHSLEPGQIHERKRTYDGFLEDYEEYISFLKEMPNYDEKTDYTTNHPLSESEWEKATKFYDTASQYSLHCFADIDQTLFIYYITNYTNFSHEIFDSSYYNSEENHFISWDIWGYLYKYKNIYETYGVNAVRSPEDKPLDPRFAKYDIEKMFPEYYDAVKKGEIPEPDINKDGKTDIQDYAFFKDLFTEIPAPEDPSYFIYAKIDAPQEVRDAFNYDYDFNNNGVSCDIGELECIELYIAKAVGASDYDDILDMLDKYYAENPSLDPIAIINEEIKNMNDPQTEEKINEEENEIISYMSSLDLFKTVTGDSNIDGNVDMSDVLLIMQSLSNPNKYKLTPQGRKNADHDDNGVTNADALAVQMGLLGL
ncbi:hypothetical protein [Ruminococcus flavefaciens]|uniref:hypothetical protein n=1 Tax=Ruminococcus flavefaciens TaxID=1265 RepID=UPI00048EE414|nr:hypothetical protein [Ruminococcus flavefaciens]